MGRTPLTAGCRAMDGNFEGAVDRLAQPARALLDIHLPDTRGNTPLSTSVLENYLVYDWLAHNVGTE
eukprot:15435451-Alexandrium_andersonii.AAC.1